MSQIQQPQFLSYDGTDISSLPAGAGWNLVPTATTGDAFTLAPSALTTGGALVLTANTLTTGPIAAITQAISADGLTARGSSDNFLDITLSRTETRTSGTTTDNFDTVSIKRSNIMNGAGGTLSASGSCLRLEVVSTETAGTLTDVCRGLEIVNAGTGFAAEIKQTGVLAATKNGLVVTTTATQVNSPLVAFNQGGASSTQDALSIINAGTGKLLHLQQTGVLAGGNAGLKLYSNAAQINVELCEFHQDNASSTAALFLLRNDGTGKSLDIAHSATVANGAHIIGESIALSSSSTPTAAAYLHGLRLQVSAADTDIIETAFNFNGSELTTVDPTQATNDIWIRCYDDVNDEVFYLRGYTA